MVSLMRAALPLSAVALLTSAGAGCTNPFGSLSCTLIGCLDGLHVQFDSPPPDGTVIEVNGSDGMPTIMHVVCGATNCDFGLYFEGYTPPYLTVHVVTPTGEGISTYEPKYVKSQPNGEDCPPTCRSATVLVELPT
jgi:hypothetical protein